MKRVLLTALTIGSCGWLYAQPAPPAPAAGATVNLPGGNQGVSLTVELPQSVKEMVSVQAVLLPYSVTKDLFGARIADTYVAVVINVGNRSRTFGLILEGLYLD